MNYFKNKKFSLIKFTQKSILLTSMVAPAIIRMDSANAMFGSLSGNIFRTSSNNTSNVRKLVSQFEKISNNNSTTTVKNNSPLGNSSFKFRYSKPSTTTTSNRPILPTKPTMPKLQPIITARGFTYPYGDESSSSTPPKNYQTTKTQTASTSSKIKTTHPSVSNTSPSNSSNNNKNSAINTTYNLELDKNIIGNNSNFDLPKQQAGDLELAIKASVAKIVKGNLSGKLLRTGPILLKFDKEAGDYLNSALTTFIYKSAINTLNSLNNQ